MPGSWENNRYAASITLHSSDSWENLWLMVHDSMMPMFEEYLNDVETNEEEGTEDNAEGQKKELRLEEVAVAPVTCAFGVVISGNYAYIADWEDGLVIVDISIPENPQVISVYDQRTEENSGKWYSPHALALKDNFIYLVTHIGELVVIDVSDPNKPTQTGYVEGDESLEGITISGNYAYIAAGGDGLYIFDISDPFNPKKIGIADTPDDAFEVEVSGDYAYVAGGGAICAIDVSNPQNPS